MVIKKSIIKKYDTDGVRESIKSLSKQIEQIVDDFSRKKNNFDKYKDINKIVVSGMGGSNLGARMISSVFSNNIKVPISICSNYDIPNFVDSRTLFILSSYSGTTEETLSTFAKAKKKKAKIFGLSSDNNSSEIKKLFLEKKIDAYIFNDKFNISKQPRLGIGYSVFALIMIFKSLNIIKLSNIDIKKIIRFLEKNNSSLDLYAKKNISLDIAKKLHKKQIKIITPSFLEGNGHVLRNQFNETSKNFCEYLVIPELNHYSLEGLTEPKKIRKNSIFLIFQSDIDHVKNIKRLLLTRKIIKKNNIEVIIFKLNQKTRLEQSMEFLQIGSWLTYYLAILNKINPVKIPWIDLFKKELNSS